VPSEARQADDNDVLDNEDKAQVIVDLRSEAKLAAQVSSSTMACIAQICCMLLVLQSVPATVKFVAELKFTAVRMPPYHPKK
jgi:hypothetical protein